MSVVWSILFGAAFLRRGRAVAAVMAVSVFSHFALDMVMHPPDLALWPGSATHLGFGLWRALPVGWWFVELGAVAAGCWYYWHRSRSDRSFGGRALAAVAVILILHLLNSPWLSAT